MVKRFFIIAAFISATILPSMVYAQWSSPTAAPPGGNPPPPVWIQAALPGTTQAGNIHIGTNAAIDGVLGLGGVPDTTLGRKLDINSTGAWGAVIRNGSAVALGIAPSFIGTITNHPLQIWANNGVRMLVGDTGNVGINQLLPAYKLDVGGDINIASGNFYRAGGTAGITLAAACAAGDVLKGVNVKGGIITAGACGTDNVGGGGGGGTVTSVTGISPISVINSTTTPTISIDTGSFIQNQTAVAQSAGFNISGNGFVGGAVGIGTTDPLTHKLRVVHTGSVTASFQNTTNAANPTETRIINNSSGGFIGTFSARPFNIMSANASRMVVLASGRIGMGANPTELSGAEYDARVTICRTVDGNGRCTVPSVAPTVLLLGSADGVTTGASSIRARGFIESQGGFRTPAGGSIQSGMTDIGEYVKVDGLTSDYSAGDALVIARRGGTFTKSTRAYDTHVAGIVTTSAGYIGGVSDDGTPPKGNVVMALVGQVPAKVSLENGIIETGDLLTTSSSQGYLMKCPIDTPEHKITCMGAVVGKALEPLTSPQGKIMVLLTLQ